LDIALLTAAWLGAYALRFHTTIPVPLGVPPLIDYLVPLSVILPLFVGLFLSNGLYTPRRMDSTLGEASAVLRATALGIFGLAALSFFFRSYSYSRLVLGIFSVLAPCVVIASRSTIRFALRGIRRRGFNLRYVLVVGSGGIAESVIERIGARPDAGLRMLGVVADGAIGDAVHGSPVIGRYADLKNILESQRVDQVFVALSRDQSDVFEKVMVELEDSVVNLKIVPDLLHGYALHSSIESFDGLPVIGFKEPALFGWGAVAKRCLDLVGASLALITLSPLLLGIALVVAGSSPGPVLYRQRRMGLDGRVFEMLKFRSMRRDAELEGPGWTRAGDPRRTRVGRWLRKRNFDELPQLINVLRGEMSLVGPRPERPAFIETFRREIPGYMLRHKVRTGMTGWAQVHGWRGDTSIHERLEHDLYYVQRWSFGLDLRILVMTLVRSSRKQPSAY